MNKDLQLYEQSKVEILKPIKIQRFRPVPLLVLVIFAIFCFVYEVKKDLEAQKPKAMEVDYEKLLFESCQCHCQDFAE